MHQKEKASSLSQALWQQIRFRSWLYPISILLRIPGFALFMVAGLVTARYFDTPDRFSECRNYRADV